MADTVEVKNWISAPLPVPVSPGEKLWLYTRLSPAGNGVIVVSREPPPVATKEKD